MTATASTVFDAILPPSPIAPTDPYFGLVTAWNTLPPSPISPADPYFGLLVAFGVQGAGAFVTTNDDTTLASFVPLVQ